MAATTALFLLANESTTVLPPVQYDPDVQGHLYPLSIAIATFVVSVLGVIGNLVTLVVIIVTKDLHNRCYMLIGYLAFSDLVCSCYYSLLRVLIFTYNYYMTNYTCFLYSVVGLFFLNTQTGLTLMLGVDRFLAVTAPYKYRKWNPIKYSICMVIPPNIYAFVITGYGFYESTSLVRVPVCFPPSAYSTTSRSLWVASNGVIVVAVLFLYTGAQLKFKQTQKKSTTDSSLKLAARVLRSLMIVMLVYASTWAFTMLMMAIISFAVYGTPAQKVIEIFLVWPVIINSSSNFVIYFWRTTEFRRATLRLFGMSSAASSTNSVQDMRTSTVVTISQTPRKSRVSQQQF